LCFSHLELVGISGELARQTLARADTEIDLFQAGVKNLRAVLGATAVVQDEEILLIRIPRLVSLGHNGVHEFRRKLSEKTLEAIKTLRSVRGVRQASLQLADLVSRAGARASALLAIIGIRHAHESLGAGSLVVSRSRKGGARSTEVVLGADRGAHFGSITRSSLQEVGRERVEEFDQAVLSQRNSVSRSNARPEVGERLDGLMASISPVHLTKNRNLGDVVAASGLIESRVVLNEIKNSLAALVPAIRAGSQEHLRHALRLNVLDIAIIFEEIGAGGSEAALAEVVLHFHGLDIVAGLLISDLLEHFEMSLHG